MAKTHIVLHHSATKDGVYRDFDSIKRGHLARGWRDIGYHWVIEKVNGVLVATPGRAENDVGAHCISRNADGIGICCVGNFQNEIPSEELYRFVANLCKNIMTRHPIREIGGHKQYDATACPGRNFNVDRVRQLVKATDQPRVIVKGKEIQNRIIDNRTWVPLREVAEAIGNKVDWDDATKTATVN